MQRHAWLLASGVSSVEGRNTVNFGVCVCECVRFSEEMGALYVYEEPMESMKSFVDHRHLPLSRCLVLLSSVWMGGFGGSTDLAVHLLLWALP